MVKLLISTTSRFSKDSPISRCIMLTSSILNSFKDPLPKNSKISNALSFKCKLSNESASNANLSRLMPSMKMLFKVELHSSTVTWESEIAISKLTRYNISIFGQAVRRRFKSSAEILTWCSLRRLSLVYISQAMTVEAENSSTSSIKIVSDWSPVVWKDTTTSRAAANRDKMFPMTSTGRRSIT
ncbi:hypothetical protein V2J09_019278 [Rumex salicifolius]